MRTFKPGGFAIVAPVALAMLAGCSGAQTASTPIGYGQIPATRPARGLPVITPPNGAAPGGLYVAEQGDYVTYEYALPNKMNNPPKCSDSLPNYGAAGIGVNAKRVLYITMYTMNEILTFGPNCGAAGPTLNDPNGGPVDVAFDNTKNIVYVDEQSTGGIAVYENGATSPTRMLSNPENQLSGGIAVDGHGNVFQSDFNNNIIEYPGGHQKRSKVLGLTGLGLPTGLEFDRKGDLIVVDDSNGILVYAPPLVGAPKKVVTPLGGCGYGKLDTKNRNLYVTDILSGAIDVYAYPSLKYKYTISSRVGLVSGVAVDPPAPN